MIGEILDNIAAYCEEELELYAPIVYGSDPPDSGIVMSQASGFPTSKHLDTGMQYTIPVVLNGKNNDQKTLLDTIESIHRLLTKTFDYSMLNTRDAQVYDISTTASPSIIGREQNRQWICGSSLDITIYWRKDIKW